MKRLRGFVIFLYIFLTVLVMIIHPVMHKPVALENVNFKIKDQLMNPQTRIVSDYQVKIKFVRLNKTVAKAPDKTIYIKPDDDRHLSLDLKTDSIYKETELQLQDNVSTTQTDLELDVAGSKNQYSEQNIGLTDQEMLYKEEHLNRDNQIPKSDMELDTQIPKADVVLKDSDEVGNWQFRGSKEEIIAWNVWRSNLQNRIMDESAIEAPVGTLILFSFDVSEDGLISNLKYTCTNKQYAKSARADMVNVLGRLERDEILNFPADTKRKNVRFKGGFLLDYTTQYSKPSDYSDYERVK